MYIRLEQGLYMVGGGSGGPGISNYKDCNVYLAEGEQDAFLIDGGSGLDNQLILDNIFETGCKPEKIRYLFLTHAHGDHGGGVKGLKALMPWIKVAASLGEKRLLEEGSEEELGLVAAKKKGAYPADYVYPHCSVDLVLEDEQDFLAADGRITAIFLPGHSVESVCYLFEKNKRRILFSGDSVYLNGTLSLINCYGSTMEGYRRNIHKLAGRGIDALIPSHYRMTLTKGQEHVDRAIELVGYSSLPPMM